MVQVPNATSTAAESAHLIRRVLGADDGESMWNDNSAYLYNKKSTSTRYTRASDSSALPFDDFLDRVELLNLFLPY